MALNIHFTGRFREGEVVGTETGDGSFAVDLLHDEIQSRFQIAHGDALVDDHSFDLMEHGGVCGVHFILAVHTAGGQNANGQFLFFHGTDLHVGGLCAEQDAAVFGQIEGIGPFPGGMTVGCVQLGEVIVGEFDLLIVQNIKAHSDKDVFNLIEYVVHGMLVANGNFLAGNGHVHGFLLQLHLQKCLGKLFIFLFQKLL